MLEAFYRERRNPSALFKPKTMRRIFKVVFCLGGVALFAVAYSMLYYPGEWTDEVTGEIMTADEGFWMASIFGPIGLLFFLAAWGSDRLPLTFNDKVVDDGGPQGPAWQMSDAGLRNFTWGKETIPWAALDYVQDDHDEDGLPCFVVYFIEKSAVEHYMSKKDAADWNPGVSYILDVGRTNVSLSQTRKAIARYCPRLFRHYGARKPK